MLERMKISLSSTLNYNFISRSTQEEFQFTSSFVWGFCFSLLFEDEEIYISILCLSSYALLHQIAQYWLLSGDWVFFLGTFCSIFRNSDRFLNFWKCLIFSYSRGVRGEVIGGKIPLKENFLQFVRVFKKKCRKKILFTQKIWKPPRNFFYYTPENVSQYFKPGSNRDCLGSWNILEFSDLVIFPGIYFYQIILRLENKV